MENMNNSPQPPQYGPNPQYGQGQYVPQYPPQYAVPPKKTEREHPEYTVVLNAVVPE